MLEVEKCPICGDARKEKIVKAPYFRGKKEEFQIVECQNCALRYTSPRPEDGELGAYYEEENYISHTDSKESLMDKIYAKVKAVSAQKKLGLIESYASKGSLFDFGAGTGYFAKAAADRGWSAGGFEPSEKARETSRNNYSVELSDSIDSLKESSADAISMWHVLEHLPDLKGDLGKISKGLKPGAYLFIAVPNHESWDAKHYKSNWAAYDVPLHLYHFKKNNIKELGREFGLDLVEVKNMPYDAFYVSLLSEKNRAGKPNPLKAFAVGIWSNLKGSSSKNMSSLIYVLKKK